MQDDPNLLTLPREIRDKIYVYLYKTSNASNLGLIPNRCSDLVLEIAPYIDDLLVHSRLYEEHSLAECFTGLSATINTLMCDCLELEMLVSHYPTGRPSHQALSHIEHLTIELNGAGSFREGGSPMQQVAPFIEELGRKAVDVDTLRIITEGKIQVCSNIRT